MQQQTSHAALMQSRVSAHVSVTTSMPVGSLIPAYNTSTRPRMHMMPAASGPQLSANIARPRVPVHGGLAAERCEKLYDADVQAGRMASVRAPAWQQNSQFSPHPQNCQLPLQPVPMYTMTQQLRVQAPVSGSVPEWSRLSGQLPYQQSERLPPHHQLQQQRHMVPPGAMIRQQLPTYQSVVDQRIHHDLMLKHTWQQRQRHFMHFQSVSHQHSSVGGVVNEPCDVGGFRAAASNDGCMMPLTSSFTAPAVAVSSAI